VVLNEEVIVPLLQALNGDAWGADLAIGAVWLVAQFAVFAWLCPKASYRWFDCLVMVVPIAGLRSGRPASCGGSPTCRTGIGGHDRAKLT
jgi:hypothetical protein